MAARPRLTANEDPATRSPSRERVAILLLILAWGTTFAAVKIGLESAPPPESWSISVVHTTCPVTSSSAASAEVPFDVTAT